MAAKFKLRFTFLWTCGGFHDVWAYDLADAKDEACQLGVKFKLKPNYSTLEQVI